MEDPKETQEIASQPTPSTPKGDPTSAPVPGRNASTLTDYQRDAIARMAVGGFPVGNIAAAVGRSPALVKKLIDSDPDVQKRVEHFHSQVLRVHADSHHSFLEMMDDAVANIRSAIHGGDARLANENAWKVVNRVFPQQTEVNVNVGGSLSLQAQHEVSTRTVSLLGSITELRESIPRGGRTYEDRVRTGADALPGPASQLPAGTKSPEEKPNGSGHPPTTDSPEGTPS